jgi:hypothetical protein
MTVYPTAIPSEAQIHLEHAMPRPYDFSDPKANACREAVGKEMERVWKGQPSRPEILPAASAPPDGRERLIAALETFVLVTQEYGMSGKQWKALRLVQEARCQ